MRCEEVREHLVAHLDGELSLEESEQIDAHIAGCADCRLERAELGSTGDLLNLLSGGPKSDIDIAGVVIAEANDGDPWCRHILRDLVAHQDGELSEKQSRPVEEHLGECAKCAEAAAGLDQTAAALALWQVPEFEIDLVEAVFARAGIRQKRGRRRIFRIAAVAAGVLLAAGLFFTFATPFGSDAPPDDVLRLMDLLDAETLTLLNEDPELLEISDPDQLDWLESIPEEELAMLNGSGG